MKKLKIVNTVAIVIPLVISIFGLLNNEILLIALALTMLTGVLQLIIGCIFWLKYPNSLLIKIYFAAVALFFTLLYLFFEQFQYLIAIPVLLCIYLSYIIYSTPNEIQ